MTDTAVTSRTLPSDATFSAALDSTSTAGTSVATGNYAVFTPAGGGNTRQTVFAFYATGTATVTWIAGDEPPSEDAAQGDSDANAVTATHAYIGVVPGGRFVQSDGTVRALIGGTGPVVCNAFTVPRTT